MVPPEKGEAFKNGFLLIFLNPKNIIFFASFLPQFINHNSPFLLQTTEIIEPFLECFFVYVLKIIFPVIFI